MPKNNPAAEMTRLLDEVDKASVGAKWVPEPVPIPTDGHDAKAFVAEFTGWRVVVVDFDITDQGFPEGSRGQDGAGTNAEKFVILRLTRPLAKKFAEIAKAHEHYHRGLLYFLVTDPRVPAKVREQLGRFGLPRDEFTDNGGWPHQLYIREARRMVSDLVMTEHHTFCRQVAPQSIGLGSYGTDTHEIRRIVKDGVVAREGKTAVGRDGASPYPVGYGAIVPKAAECENLFVTFALSASHTAFSSIRMEPVFMVLSQSAATAACLALEAQTPVQQVDYAKLAARLKQDGQVLAWHSK